MTTDINDISFIRKFVLEHTSNVLDEDKEELIEARLGPLLDQEGLRSMSELVDKLCNEPLNDLNRRVIDALMINETTFFRDFHPFEALKKVILPELIQKREMDREIEIWCAACSTGQEPYSVAMLLRENFPSLNDWKIHIIATDISREVLNLAREGVFSQLEVNRGLPAHLLVKYFEQGERDQWRIKDTILSMVDFHQINLADPWSALPDMDIILMRNVLIYFDIEKRKEIFEKLRSHLKMDGYLFLGGSETTLFLDDEFETINFKKTLFFRLRSGKSQL